MGMREIYRKIAKEHGVSPKEVKREMQAAIDYAYNKTEKSEMEKIMQERIPCKDRIPTTKEFVEFMTKVSKSNDKY